MHLFCNCCILLSCPPALTNPHSYATDSQWSNHATKLLKLCSLANLSYGSVKKARDCGICSSVCVHKAKDCTLLTAKPCPTLEKTCILKCLFPLSKISTVRFRCSGKKSLSVLGTEKKIGAYSQSVNSIRYLEWWETSYHQLPRHGSRSKRMGVR